MTLSTCRRDTSRLRRQRDFLRRRWAQIWLRCLDRQRVPYQPFFVDQVAAGNVREITSQADSIDGELKREASYDPAGDAPPGADPLRKISIIPRG